MSRMRNASDIYKFDVTSYDEVENFYKEVEKQTRGLANRCRQLRDPFRLHRGYDEDRRLEQRYRYQPDGNL